MIETNGAARHGGSRSMAAFIAALPMLWNHIRAVDARQPIDGWITRDELLDPHAGPLAALLDGIGKRYADSRRHAAAASFMLRFGWSAGPMIAAHLALRCSVRYPDYALRFGATTAIEAVCIDRGEPPEADGDTAAARRGLVDALVAHTEPVLEAQHRWSGVKRRTLWSMAASIWAAQCVEVAERLGDAELGRREAAALFELRPELHAAAPRLYAVAVGERHGVCQVRGACCLSHKAPGGRHCMVCPLISDAERARRNGEWLAGRASVRVIDATLLAGLRQRCAA